MQDLQLKCHEKFMHLSRKIMRSTRININELGFTRNQYVVMYNIQPGESLTLSEISERLVRKNSNVTALVDFLEEKNIIRRINDTQDRRIIRVALTEEGVKRRQQVIDAHQKFLKGLYKEIEGKQLKEFIDMIDDITSKMV